MASDNRDVDAMISPEEMNMIYNALECLIIFSLGWICCIIFNWVFRAVRMEKYENNKIQKDTRSSYTPE